LHSWKEKNPSAGSWAFGFFGPTKRSLMDRSQPPGRRWRRITMNCRSQLPTAVRTPAHSRHTIKNWHRYLCGISFVSLRRVSYCANESRIETISGYAYRESGMSVKAGFRGLDRSGGIFAMLEGSECFATHRTSVSPEP
jgi:hypothetical protein